MHAAYRSAQVYAHPGQSHASTGVAKLFYQSAVDHREQSPFLHILLDYLSKIPYPLRAHRTSYYLVLVLLSSIDWGCSETPDATPSTLSDRGICQFSQSCRHLHRQSRKPDLPLWRGGGW